MAHDSVVPATAGDDKEIVFVRSVLADLAEPDAQPIGADPRNTFCKSL